jgi:hypothetical protein
MHSGAHSRETTDAGCPRCASHSLTVLRSGTASGPRARSHAIARVIASRSDHGSPRAVASAQARCSGAGSGAARSESPRVSSRRMRVRDSTVSGSVPMRASSASVAR